MNSIDHHGILGSALTDGAPSGGARLLWADESDTAAFAARLAAAPALRHAVLALHGDLGAGKTTLARHLLRALGVAGRVKSPTYTVVEPYDAPGAAGQDPLKVWHFDFYRFNDPREWEDAGFRELFAQPGLKLVEWPEKAHGMMPLADADITLEPMDNNSRQVTVTAHSAAGLALLAALAA